MHKIYVVIPCYRVKNHILQVIEAIGSEVIKIIVVDDGCPEHSGQYVEKNCSDPRVKVIYNSKNLGVGGAMLNGYRESIAEGADVIVKIDGDGQMDPSLIMEFVNPILLGEADYTKGNRFFNLDNILRMPKIRIFGNAVLSLLTKISSGYWDLFDPTNGYTAIHSHVAKKLPFDKISSSYFFETDILFRLGILRAVVRDIPMDAFYGEEKSSLRIVKILPEFLNKHFLNFMKRIFYNYYLRDVSLASIELPIGLFLFAFGVIFGSISWFTSTLERLPTSAGTVMLSALPTLMGAQLVLAFFAYDISSVPRVPRQKTLTK